MIRAERNGCFDILRAFIRSLIRQREHQVEIDVVEVCLRNLDGAARLTTVVNASERLQVGFVETLDADRQSIDACLAKAAKLFCFKGAGIGFHGDLSITRERDARTHGGEDFIDARCRKQAWRAAAEEHGVYAPAPDIRQRVIEIRDECVDVAALGNIALALVAVEITVGALAHAPWDMDVERKRRQRRQRNPVRQMDGTGHQRSTRNFSASACIALPR